MKRLFSLALCAVLILTVFSGCGPQADTQETTQAARTSVLKVGYARVDITPQEAVPMRGLGSSSERFSAGVKDPLYATCVAFSDETGNAILMYHMDLCHSFTAATLSLKAAVARATGISGNQIMVTATHNHSAPDLDNSQIPSIERYMDALKDWMIQAAEEALADRKEAEMYTATAYPEKMNFIRHYKMSDGSVAGDNFGDFKSSTIVDHMLKSDNAMQLIKFTRAGGKDVLLMNWQGHPRGHGEDKTKILSDVDVIRKKLESELDCHFAYFLGASGNVNNSSRIKEERVTNSYEEHGNALAQYAIEAAAGFAQVPTGELKIVSNQYQATSKEDSKVKLTLPLFAFSLGDVAFVTAPYEMFCESGLAIKEGSPFSMTFVATCANANYSYIPTAATFAYGGYEVSMTKTAQGTAELLTAEYISMLKQIHTS